MKISRADADDSPGGAARLKSDRLRPFILTPPPQPSTAPSTPGSPGAMASSAPSVWSLHGSHRERPGLRARELAVQDLGDEALQHALDQGALLQVASERRAVPSAAGHEVDGREGLLFAVLAGSGVDDAAHGQDHAQVLGAGSGRGVHRE